MADDRTSHAYYSTGIRHGLTVLGYQDGEVIIQEGGRIFRVSPEQARLREERHKALEWLLAAVAYDPDAVLDILEASGKRLSDLEGPYAY